MGQEDLEFILSPFRERVVSPAKLTGRKSFRVKRKVGGNAEDQNRKYCAQSPIANGGELSISLIVHFEVEDTLLNRL